MQPTPYLHPHEVVPRRPSGDKSIIPNSCPDTLSRRFRVFLELLYAVLAAALCRHNLHLRDGDTEAPGGKKICLIR